MKSSVAFYGPEIDTNLSDWLARGGPFPPRLSVRLAGPSDQMQVMDYQILDRDEDGYIAALSVGRRGKKGFVLRVRSEPTGQELAAKLCIPADYADGRSPLLEVDYTSKLRGAEDIFQLPHGVGRVSPFASQPVSADARDWVCFLTDWLPGKTVQSLLEERADTVAPDLVVQVGEALLTAVLVLEQRGLKHDDLHLGNLMMVETDPNRLAIDSSLPRYRLKVIDLGSLKNIERPTFKSDDDWSMVARALAQLHNVLVKNRGVASRYPNFIRQLNSFIQNLAEEDLTRHFPAPASYIARFREVAGAATSMPRSQVDFHPFDAISAEHLANDRLLLELFVGHLPWISLVKTREPSVLIGPRGCGKSMVFRYLSLRTHVSSTTANIDALRQIGFFGVYVGCASDLGNDLLWISREEGRPQRLASSITTYFNLILTRELLRTLAASARVAALSAELGLTTYAKSEIAGFIQDQLGDELGLIRLAGMDPLQSCSDLIDQLRLRLSRGLLEGRSPDFQLPSTFLRDLCQKIIDCAPGFADWRIVFLLDDYTIHRLSRPIQSIINAVLWQRTSTHVFKISSEPHGFEATHVDNARIDEHREFVPIDTGSMPTGQDEAKHRLEFISKLLDKRLEAARYVGRTRVLIGDSEHRTDPALAKHIRAVKGERSGARPYYHGIHVLSSAWSGDVATVLHMVREMFVRASVGRSSDTKIPHKIQHESISRVSTALRERVGGYHPYGQEMARVLSAAGDLARKLLIEAPDKVNRKMNPVVHRKYRFEMTLPAGVDLESKLLTLPEGRKVVDIMHELVRRAIFVQLPPSRGKEGDARRTLRWQLRASLLPSFGTSLVRHNYIDIKRIEDFIEFITDPEAFAKKAYDRYSKTSKDDLFSDLDLDIDGEGDDE